MNKLSSITLLATLFLACNLIGCTKKGDEHVGIEGTGDSMAARGVVTKLGSIYVNGIHFNTDEAEIYFEGELTTEEAIAQGMVVSVEGTLSDSTTEAVAHKVEFSYMVSGKIESIDVDQDNMLHLSMPGYSVIVPENTVFNGTSYDQLSIDDRISVSGLVMEAGILYASQIQAVTDNTQPITLQGHVSNLATGAYRFDINGVTINYLSATAFAGQSLESLAHNQEVRVVGHFSESDGNLLLAESIRQLEEIEYNSWANVTEEGFIYSVESSLQFRVNGVNVDASIATVNGGIAEDLVEKARVSVRGRYQNNQLIASEVHILHLPNFQTFGRVTGVSNEFRGQYSFTVGDIEFNVDHFTAFLDTGHFANRYFDIHDLRNDDQVDVFARRSGDSWTAISVKRQPPSEFPFTIKGRIRDVDEDGNFYLHDIFVNTENVPDNARWDYQAGQDVFVIGTMTEGLILIARDVHPQIHGCTHWNFDECHPLPPSWDESFPYPSPATSDDDKPEEDDKGDDDKIKDFTRWKS